MICSFFNFCPQSAQSRRNEGASLGLSPTKQSSTIENLLATVLSLLLIHLLQQEAQSYPNLKKMKYGRSGKASPKFWVGQNV